MAIDPAIEQMIPVREIGSHVPGNPCLNTVYRWLRRSDNPLEAVKVGGRIFSSREAVSRFLRAYTNESQSADQGGHR